MTAGSHAASATRSAGWVRALADLVVAPRSAFRTIRDRAPWAGLLVLMTISSIALSHLMGPFVESAAQAALEEAATAQQLEQARQHLALARVVGYASAPVVLALEWLFGGSLIWLLVHACGGTACFSRAFSLAAYTSVVPHLRSWSGYLSLATAGPGAVRSVEDLRPALGLDLVFSSDHAGIASLLANLNPFGLWYAGLLAYGTFVALRSSKPVAGLVAAAYWGTLLGMQAILAGLVDSMTP